MARTRPGHHCAENTPPEAQGHTNANRSSEIRPIMHTIVQKMSSSGGREWRTEPKVYTVVQKSDTLHKMRTVRQKCGAIREPSCRKGALGGTGDANMATIHQIFDPESSKNVGGLLILSPKKFLMFLIVQLAPLLGCPVQSIQLVARSRNVRPTHSPEWQVTLRPSTLFMKK